LARRFGERQEWADDLAGSLCEGARIKELATIHGSRRLSAFGHRLSAGMQGKSNHWLIADGRITCFR
jgi:hypothetical protein